MTMTTYTVRVITDDGEFVDSRDYLTEMDALDAMDQQADVLEHGHVVQVIDDDMILAEVSV